MPSQGYLRARRLALAFVALQEAGHEEFLRQRRQLHAAGLAVADDACRSRRSRPPRPRPAAAGRSS